MEGSEIGSYDHPIYAITLDRKDALGLVFARLAVHRPGCRYKDPYGTFVLAQGKGLVGFVATSPGWSRDGLPHSIDPVRSGEPQIYVADIGDCHS